MGDSSVGGGDKKNASISLVGGARLSRGKENSFKVKMKNPPCNFDPESHRADGWPLGTSWTGKRLKWLMKLRLQNRGVKRISKEENRGENSYVKMR